MVRIAGVSFLVFLVILLALSFWKKGIYQQEVGINLVVVGELKIAVLSIRPNEEMVYWADLPNNLSVKVYKTGAVYPATSLWKLGLADRDQYRYVTQSLSMAMGLSLPRMVWVGKETSVESLLRALGAVTTSTDLSWKDRIMIRNDLENFAMAKKIMEVDLPEAGLNKNIEPDGKEVITFNAILSLWNKNKFLVEPILGEAINARVYNASGVNGVGATLSKQLEVAGVRVIEVETKTGLPKEKNGCYYLFGQGLHPLTEMFIKNHLGCHQKTPSVGQVASPNEVHLWIF